MNIYCEKCGAFICNDGVDTDSLNPPYENIGLCEDCQEEFFKEHPLSEEEIKEIQRRIEDMDDTTRYVILSKIGPMELWHESDGDTWCNQIEYATLYKREKYAKAIIGAMRDRESVQVVKVQLDKNNKISIV